MNRPVTLNIHELRYPFSEHLSKGRLLAGTPSRNKPRDMSPLEWCACIVKLATAEDACRLAIPLSFWPDGGRGYGGDALLPHISVPDQPVNVNSVEWETPRRSVEEIVDALKRGEDVLVLSATKTISGFIPAILGSLTHPDCHIEKMLWPIQHDGYVLTPAQRGYIAGLLDFDRLKQLNLEQRWDGET